MELEKLQQIIAEVLNVDASEVMPGTTFTEDLGADSLDLYQIILGFRELWSKLFSDRTGNSHRAIYNHRR